MYTQLVLAPISQEYQVKWRSYSKDRAVKANTAGSNSATRYVVANLHSNIKNGMLQKYAEIKNMYPKSNNETHRSASSVTCVRRCSTSALLVTAFTGAGEVSAESLFVPIISVCSATSIFSFSFTAGAVFETVTSVLAGSSSWSLAQRLK